MRGTYMKPNLDELMNDAGVPTTEEVLLEELAKAKSKVYALTGALRSTRGELKEVRRELNKRIREDKKKQKQHFRKGQKRGRNGFNG
jgi:hypothetical protein